MTHIGPQIAAATAGAPSVDDDVAHMLAASAGSLPQHLADPKREWVCEWEGQGAGQWGGTHMTTNTLKLVINVYRYYGTRGASVSFVCLPWRKTFSQAPKKRTLPSAPAPLLPIPAGPPLNLCADNEMQTNHVGETSTKCRAERRFMGAKWKYYHKQ